MPNYRYDIQQNSEEWFEIKVGKFSASTCAELLMDKKNKGYTNLINRIVEERITGKKTESNQFSGNQYTERGHELEPVAREDYEMRTFNDVSIVGVVELDDWTLCSPDGLINNDGLWQAKCPIFSTQMEYIKKKEVPTNYYKQMQFELFVTGRDYNIFYSYHPNLPAVEIVVKRDETIINEIIERIEQAKCEVNSEINFIKSIS